MTSSGTKKIKVLHVENDQGLLRLIQKNLECQGYQVDSTTDGEEAILMQKNTSYDVILLDQNMPSMKGTTIIKEISPKVNMVPVVMLTGSGDEAVAVEAMKLGACDYIIKDPQGNFFELLPSVLNRAIRETNLLKEKRELTYELRRSNEDLQNFAYIASHDLQEPLRKIVSFSDRLQALAPDMKDKGREYLEKIIKSANRMQSLVETLLKYSKVGVKELAYQWVDLKAIVDEVLVDLEIKLAETKGVVKVEQLPSLEADPIQMRQLFQNLISNALKFHKKGEPPSVHLISSDDGKENWEIRVRDNGIGVDSKNSGKIFHPFVRLHGVSNYEGFGIGLATCKKIVNQHKGEITFESNPGEGTTFIITLPEKQSKVN